MSQLKVNDSIKRHITRILNEEFFDEHPNSFNLERIRLSKTTIIFIDTQTPKAFLIRIHYDHWKEAKQYVNLYRYIVRDGNLQIDVYRDRNVLFLRKMLL